MDKECTFKPYLVTKDSKLTQSVLQDCLSHQGESAGQRGGTPTKYTPPTSGVNSGNTSVVVVFDRLAQIAANKKKLQENVITRSNEENIDPITGQPYFHPQVGRSPRNMKREPPKVGEHLY